MKKVIFIVLASVLIVGGLGGFVYAQGEHEPMTGLKLVGMGRLGTELQIGGKAIYLTRFAFNNPDCVSEITLRQISIFDPAGSVIYEGDLLKQTVEDGEVVNSTVWMSPMAPHECRSIVLWTYFADPADGWMSLQEVLALEEEAVGYTLELFYTKDSPESLPLIGHAGTTKKMIKGKKLVAEAGFRNEMFNMKQIVEPE